MLICTYAFVKHTTLGGAEWFIEQWTPF